MAAEHHSRSNPPYSYSLSRYTALQVKRSTTLYITLTRLHVDDLITPVTAAAAAAAAARTPTCSYGHVDNVARRMDLQSREPQLAANAPRLAEERGRPWLGC